MNRPVRRLSWGDVQARAMPLFHVIMTDLDKRSSPPTTLRIYGVPRGGIPAALIIQSVSLGFQREAVLVSTPEDADIIVDDIIDTGNTRLRYQRRMRKWSSPSTLRSPFYALVNVADKEDPAGIWWEFPWEAMCNEAGPEENVRRMLEYIGENPEREGLVETPQRVLKSYGSLFAGYATGPEELPDLLKTFEDGACDEMVVLRDIEFYSTCEHHMLPFFGRASIGYIPNGKVVGISKLARLLEVFARRLQIQERIGQQVTEALQEILDPKGCGCVLKAQHLCMTARGIQKQNSVMVTSSLRGAFLDKPEARAEFLRMAGMDGGQHG